MGNRLLLFTVHLLYSVPSQVSEQTESMESASYFLLQKQDRLPKTTTSCPLSIDFQCCAKNWGPRDDPNLHCLSSTGTASFHTAQMQAVLNAVGDKHTAQRDQGRNCTEQGLRKDFRVKGHLPRLKGMEQEESLCHWTVCSLPLP